MSDYLHARSGVLAGAVLAAFAAVVLGGLAFFAGLCVVACFVRGGSASATDLLALGVGGAAGGLFGTFAYESFGQWALWDRLHREGVPTAAATLLGSERTGHRINRRHLHRIRLRVTPPGGQPYEATALWFFPPSIRAAVRDGDAVTVRVDPADASKLVVDWDATRSRLALPPGG